VSRLDAEETVIGLLASPVSRPVEDSAALHLATIRRMQPKGPYRIGGECIGGVIAYEVAQQLRERGETVELLLLLDAWCPTGDGRVPRRSLGRWLAPRRIVDKSVELVRAGASFLAELPNPPPAARPWPLELWQRLTVPREVKRHMEACMRYRPRPYPGQVTIVASAASLRRGLADPWRALASGGTVVHEAPGDHDSYSRRYYRQTAEQLRVCLERQERGKVLHGDAG